MSLYDLMSYTIPFYDINLLASTYVCLILTLWMYDYQQTTMVPLCLLVSGKNIHILFFSILLSLIYWLYFLIGITPMIRYINFLKTLTCVCLVMKYPIMKFAGNHSTLNYFLMIRSVMKKNECWCDWCACYLMTSRSYPGEWRSFCLGKQYLPWIGILDLPKSNLYNIHP